MKPSTKLLSVFATGMIVVGMLSVAIAVGVHNRSKLVAVTPTTVPYEELMQTSCAPLTEDEVQFMCQPLLAEQLDRVSTMSAYKIKLEIKKRTATPSAEPVKLSTAPATLQ